MNVRKAANMERMIEKVLEQKKLVLVEDEQQRAKIPFTKDVMARPLFQKFKIPQLPTFLRKEDPNEHVQNTRPL